MNPICRTQMRQSQRQKGTEKTTDYHYIYLSYDNTPNKIINLSQSFDKDKNHSPGNVAGCKPDITDIPEDLYSKDLFTCSNNDEHADHCQYVNKQAES